MSLLEKFIRSSDRVVEFSVYFSSIPQEDHTPHSLEVQKDEIIHLWTGLRSAYDDVLSKRSVLKEEISVETIKNKYFSAYNAHLKCFSKANELLSSFKLNPTGPSNETKPLTTSVDRFHLPPCDMDAFYGDYSSWPTFRDQFSALYGDQAHISPVEKLCHLMKKTKGEAHDIVKSCPFTNAGFRMAWNNLIERYENKRVLVNAQLKILLSLSPITKESGPTIKALQRTINNCVSNLALLNIDTKNWDVIFVYICSTCLPDVTLNLWEQSIKDVTGLPSWKEMDAFLSSRFHTLESVSDIRTTSNPATYSKNNSHFKTDNPRGSRRVNSYHTNVSQNKTSKCILCQDCHPLRLCPQFLAMSVDDRFALVKDQNRCTNCLATSHDFRKCKSQFVCSTCKQRHHSLLHRTILSNPNSNPISRPLPETQTHVVTSTSNNLPFSLPMDAPSTPAADRNHQSYSTLLQTPKSNLTLLGTALVTTMVGDLCCTVRALIDPASEASFISRSLQRKLTLPFRSSHTNVIGLSGSIATTSSQIGQIEIKSALDPHFSTHVDVFVVENLTGSLPSYSHFPLDKSDFSNLPLADSSNQQGSQIDLLLGGDIYPKIIRDGLRWNKNRTLVAQQSVFGWIITGRLDYGLINSSLSSFFNKLDVNHLLSRFWELEEVPTRPTISDDEKYCEELYRRTTYRNSSGRFVVSLPFIRNFPYEKALGQSRNIAMSQYVRNETRLSKDMEYKSKYDEVILEYLTLNHMKSVTPDLTSNPKSYYLPHHAVLKPDSTTAKLRIIFNTSCPSCNGVLYPGPVLQSDLPTLIIRWRFLNMF